MDRRALIARAAAYGSGPAGGGTHERPFPEVKRPPWTCRELVLDGEITRLGYRRFALFTDCNGAFSARTVGEKIAARSPGSSSGLRRTEYGASRIGASDRCANVAHCWKNSLADSGQSAIRISPSVAPPNGPPWPTTTAKASRDRNGRRLDAQGVWTAPIAGTEFVGDWWKVEKSSRLNH